MPLRLKPRLSSCKPWWARRRAGEILGVRLILYFTEVLYNYSCLWQQEAI